MNGLLWFLALLNLYLILVFVLVRTGAMKRYNLSLFGPALMIKTQRGRGLLDWFARARGFFSRAADFGIVVTAIVMFLMSLLLVVQLPFLFQLPPEAAPSPRYILGIPGINPIIPVGFGIIALIFAVVVHEFSHGILARVHNLRVKTMGLLFLIVPIGAFVEPDEVELKAAPRRHRIKVFAAGPMSNLFFAILFGVVFSTVLMGAAKPVPGVPLQTVIVGGPAENAGLRPGDIITQVNDVAVHNPDEYTNAVRGLQPNQSIVIWSFRAEDDNYDVTQRSVTTGRCIDYYSEAQCRAADHPDPLNRSVIGVSVYDTARIKGYLVHPFSDVRGFLLYIGLPFEAIQGQFPLSGIYQHFYVVPFHAPTFWFLVNLVFWFYWINLMLGLTNALPIVPLDGGYMFKDFVASWVDRWSPTASPEKKERIVKRTSTIVALTLLVLVILQFVAPYLAALFRGFGQ